MAANLTTSTTDIRLQAYENASPAFSLDLTVGYDGEGWPVTVTFTVGQIVADEAGRLYKVIGFLKNDLVVVVQYGLEMDRAISSLVFRHTGLELVDAPICGF